MTFMCSNLTAMTKELEKQLVSFADTNGDILKHIENLNEEGGKYPSTFGEEPPASTTASVLSRNSCIRMW